jgi:hypothetical protein
MPRRKATSHSGARDLTVQRNDPFLARDTRIEPEDNHGGSRKVSSDGDSPREESRRCVPMIAA